MTVLSLPSPLRGSRTNLCRRRVSEKSVSYPAPDKPVHGGDCFRPVSYGPYAGTGRKAQTVITHGGKVALRGRSPPTDVLFRDKVRRPDGGNPVEAFLVQEVHAVYARCHQNLDGGTTYSKSRCFSSLMAHFNVGDAVEHLHGGFVRSAPSWVPCPARR